MQDITIQAALKSAKITARKNPDRPDQMIRRVQIQLQCSDFSEEHAEWLGEEAIVLRRQLQSRALKSFDLLINAYHAQLAFAGARGNAEAEGCGVSACASVVGKEAEEHEELTLTFELVPTATALTFVAASLKEVVDVDIKAMVLELPNVEDRLRQAVGALRDSVPKGTTMTMSVSGGRETTIEGTGEPRT
jgi:hypothetical protein